MLVDPPRMAPKWLTPEMVVDATPLDRLDVIARGERRVIRLMLLCAVARRAVADLRIAASRPYVSEGGADRG